MPELRKDPVSGRLVIIATGRAKRPTDFVVPPEPLSKGVCPFCPGNEHMTPPTILSYPEDEKTKWAVRVVSNKFPALRIEGELDKLGDGIYDRMNGIGAHEVIIESPNHVTSYSDIDEKNARKVILAYHRRLTELRKDKRFNYGMIFKNVGEAAGASLEHTHSQLIALPTIPLRVQEELSGGEKFFAYRGRCIFCDMIRQEKNQGLRVVLETDHYIAFEPFAARFPFETWLMPKSHISHFIHIKEEEIDDLGKCLHQTLARINNTLNRPPYNFMIHTSPFTTDMLEYYHWHIEITPRLTKVAGFEWGTGFYINPVAPEQAATYLRDSNP